MSYGKIYIRRLNNAEIRNSYIGSWKDTPQTRYTKYNIKETDFRIKTATFTSPQYIDLTMGQYAILISSSYHENFSGIILDCEYNEDTGLYDYQCQDWSRRFMNKPHVIAPKNKLYYVLMNLITHGGTSIKPTAAQKTKYKALLSGLRPLGMYEQSLYSGNIYKGNYFDKNISVMIKGKTEIEAIRSLVYTQLGQYDVWFNDKGILQIEPLSKTDWENTGLVLGTGSFTDRKFKFSTTNAITNVTLEGDGTKVGKEINPVSLDLTAFFGTVGESVSNPNSKNTSNAAKTNTSSKKTTSTKTTTIKNKYGNPYMNKPKKVWVNADTGSGDFKTSVVNALKKKGWSVHKSGTGPNVHYKDYTNVKKNYVLITIYNGFCCGTIREEFSSKIQSKLKKKNVVVVPMFDTRSWINRKAMKPYRYGNFKGAYIKRAHDDNFSKSDPSIKDVEKYFKSVKAHYCAGPSVSEALKQFYAGGYFAYKGIKV